MALKGSSFRGVQFCMVPHRLPGFDSPKSPMQWACQQMPPKARVLSLPFRNETWEWRSDPTRILSDGEMFIFARRQQWGLTHTLSDEMQQFWVMLTGNGTFIKSFYKWSITSPARPLKFLVLKCVIKNLWNFHEYGKGIELKWRSISQRKQPNGPVKGIVRAYFTNFICSLIYVSK